jgi:hypothetical protein
VADFDCNTLCVVAGACPPPDPPTSSGEGEEVDGEEDDEVDGEEEEVDGEEQEAEAEVEVEKDEKDEKEDHPTVLSLSSASSSSSSTSPSANGNRNQLSDDPDLCGICTSVLSQLHEAVTDPEKQKEAMATAARVCSALHKFRDECLGDVQQYGPLVINTVGQYVGPDLCAAAGLCSGPSWSASRPEEKSSAERTVDVA